MIKTFVLAIELNNIADLHLVARDLAPEGTDTLIFGDEVIEKIHTGPRWRTVINGNIIPAKKIEIVHHTRAGIHALGDKIRAVATKTFKVGKQRISAKRPSIGIHHGAFAQIRFLNQHKTSPFLFIICINTYKVFVTAFHFFLKTP